MLKIYGTNLSSPANKVRMCANALGLEYQYIQIKLIQAEHKQAEFLKINPVGMVPVMDDNGFCLSESNTIMRYLCRKHNSKLYPQELIPQARVDQWCDFSSMHVGAAIGRVLYNTVFAPMLNKPVNQQSIKDCLTFLERFLPVVDNQLAKTPCIAGDEMTIADICLLACTDPAELLKIDLTPHTHFSAWRKKMCSKDFYQQVHARYGAELVA